MVVFLAVGMVPESIGGNLFNPIGYFAKFDGSGNLMCEEIFPELSSFNGVSIMENGDFVIASSNWDSISFNNTYVMRWSGDYCPIIINNTTDLFNKNDDPKIYPQPMTDFANFEFKQPLSQASTFTLFDLLGNKILSKNLQKQQQQFTLNRGSLSAGTYIYHIQTQKDIYSGKVIVVE